ncbi:MAG: hypothetical protein ACJ8D7_05800, partial [Xanthobacteraceae bacterium]
ESYRRLGYHLTSRLDAKATPAAYATMAEFFAAVTDSQMEATDRKASEATDKTATEATGMETTATAEKKTRPRRKRVPAPKP